MVSTLMDIAYKHESDANVKERVLLVRRFNSDGKEVAMICKEELHRFEGLGLQMVVKVPKRRLGRFKKEISPAVEDLRMYLKRSFWR